MISLPPGYAWDESFELGPESAALTARVWPKFITEDSDLPEPGLRATISATEFKRRFPAWGIRHLSTHRLVAFANAALVEADLDAPTLPEEGWSFAIRSALTSRSTNALCLLVANVDPEARGLGLSEILIARAKLAARELGYEAMLAPVRPTHKHRSPMTSMFEYLASRSDALATPDPWIQLHIKSGGRVVNICHESVVVRASLEKWREWTGLTLEKSGEQVLPQGLVPLSVDLARNLGVYREPNVWVRY